MFEIQLIPALLIFFCGTIAGISLTLLFNKMRTGSASASKIKQEMEDYQGQVEAHFEETSKKFKDMAAQYQDLYKHLSVGATTLCRSENSIAGLSDLRDPLSMAPKIEPPVKQTEAPNTKTRIESSKMDKGHALKKELKNTTSEKKAEPIKEQQKQNQTKSTNIPSSPEQPQSTAAKPKVSKKQKPV